MKLSLIASLITAVFGQFFGYITTRGRGKWYGNAVEQLIFIPYLMPGVAFSAIYFSMFSQPRLGGLIPSLYGTFTLILLVSIVKHFPFASRSGSSNMMQISVELEEAATINGAGFWRRIRSIVIPLAKNGFLSGFLLSFISIAKELDLIAILLPGLRLFQRGHAPGGRRHLHRHHRIHPRYQPDRGQVRRQRLQEHVTSLEYRKEVHP